MKVLLLISITITLAIAASGQNVSFKRGATCANRNVEEISSRETIKIGAKIDDVLNLFASNEDEKQRIRNSGTGRSRANLGYVFFIASPRRNDDRFEGIAHYYFHFLDGRLTSFTVGYTKPKWKNAKQFAEKVSEIFDLPQAEYWGDQVTTRAAIQCENYRVEVDTNNVTESGHSYFGVYDNRIDEILKQRQQKLEDEQREMDLKTFKP